jgi:hypothetical protein
MVAGQGFKDFVVGEVLTSSDVDGFLMQQSVMRFADDGARGSALGTAVGTAVPLAEGMVAYLDDINQIQVYSGSSWTSPLPGIGSNVVQAVKTDTFTTSSSSFVTVDGLSVTITPSSASSKILLIGQVEGFGSSTSNGSYGFRFTGGNTDNYRGALVGSRPQSVTGSSWATDGPTRAQLSHSLVYLDSPSTTSPVTYNLAGAGFTGTLYVNFAETSENNNRGVRNASSITAIEVAA